MPDALDIEWSEEATARRRDQYYAASQRKFVPFKEPMVFRKGAMQYLWDVEGRKYIDLLGMNVCVSVGHSHPTVVKAAMAQAQELTHCTTMF
jgi:alanine-glyoxylate transaminase / (R)-3-amino-2-methylpropionate-pyruvate transaminase